MNRKINKTDVKIILIMTILYLFISLFHLGSFKSPQTGWNPESINESFIVDFGKDVTIEKIMLFGGLGKAWGCFGTLEIEANQDGVFKPYTFVDLKSIFKWHFSTDKITTDKLRISTRYLRSEKKNETTNYYQAEYREMGFFNNDKLISDYKIENINSKIDGVKRLFDEQNFVPNRPTFLNSTYFDEVYFPRTALEQLEHRDLLYENTHPPLGKTLIAIGISIFGMNPFGWRIMGTLFGAALIPLMYVLAKRFFKDSFWAFFCAFLMMFDFMHFTQTRLATIDSYTVFFVMLMFYYMLDYYDSMSYEKGFFKSLLPLLLCGISLGLGAATKWIALYGAFGLAILFFMSRGYEYSSYNNQLNIKLHTESETKDFKVRSLTGWLGKYFYLTCLFCILFFIIIPAGIYILSFIPIDYKPDNKSLVASVFESIKSMFDYHKGVVEVHPYASSWYQWPFDVKPIFYFQGELLPSNKGAAVYGFGNPLLFWTGLISFFTIIIIMIKNVFKKDNNTESNKLLWFPVIGYLSQYLPWVVAPRKITFIYHYFSCVPFLILMIAIFFRHLESNNIIRRKFTRVYLVVFAVLFVLFYPILSGIEIPIQILNILKIWEWPLWRYFGL